MGSSQLLGSAIFFVWGKQLLNTAHLFFHCIVQDGLEVLSLTFNLGLDLLVLLGENLVLCRLLLLETGYTGGQLVHPICERADLLLELLDSCFRLGLHCNILIGDRLFDLVDSSMDLLVKIGFDLCHLLGCEGGAHVLGQSGLCPWVIVLPRIILVNCGCWGRLTASVMPQWSALGWLGSMTWCSQVPE